MDPYYMRQRRRRRLVRFVVVCAFFGLLSLPVLYLLRSEIRLIAATAYRYAKSQIQSYRTIEAPVVVERSAPASIPQSPPPPPASAVSAAAQPKPPPVPTQTVKLGDATFRVPEGYVQKKEDLGSQRNPELLLRALLPDLRPRGTGRGVCAPKEVRCPDFALVKLLAGRAPIETEITKRYKAPPGSIAVFPGIHGLQQILPRRAQPGDGRAYLAQPAGRWVWITCRDFGRPMGRQPTWGICQLAFDTTDGLGIRVRFDRDRLGDWSNIYAKATELAARIRG